MQEQELPQLKRGRGHPGSKSKSEVVNRLLAAAESQLEKFGLAQVTERTIAAEAQVNHAMIHYYFGGIEGLLETLLDQASATVKSAYTRLATETEWLRLQPTRHLIRTVIEAYYAKPWLARILISQMAPEYSVMRETFLKRYGPRGQIQLQRLLDRMIEQGIYDRKVDTAYVAMTMMSVIIAPLVLTRFTDSIAISVDDLLKDRWIDHLTDLFERQLCSGVSEENAVSQR